MIDIVAYSLSMSLGVIKAYFFFFGLPMPQDSWDEWIENDGFRGNPKKNKYKAYLFDELSLAKKDFKDFLDSNKTMNDTLVNMGGARLVNQYTNAHAFRIKKIRLMIEFTVYINTNINPYGIKYLLAKSCWISNKNGKIIKKFTKLIGQEDAIKIGGKIPAHVMDEVEKELEITMWTTYQKEYPARIK
jgi:hypothetical protein